MTTKVKENVMPVKSEVTMVVSVGGDLIAGETYKLPPGEADRLILNGYAEGELSRDYSDDEASAARSTAQVVNV